MKRNLKILIVAGIFPPDIGGPASYIPLLSKYLIKQGHTITVICFSDVNNHDFDDQEPYEIIRIKRRDSIIRREFQTIKTINRYAKESDLIYANGNDFKAFIAAQITKKPIVHKIVGDTSWERAQNKKWYSKNIDDYQEDKKPLKLKFLDWVRSYPLRKANKIITPSFYLKGIVKKWHVNPEKIKVIYNGYKSQINEDESLNVSLPSFNGETAITVSRLVPWKGIDQIIYQLTLFKNLRLVIVGGGPEEKTLKSYAKRLNVSDRTLFLGNVPKKHVPLYLKIADFFILNSSYEGLPHVILEAMEAKTPVIATKVGGTPEVTTHKKNGILVDYGNREELEKGIRYFFSNKLESQKLAMNAKITLESQFNLHKMLSETEKEISNLAL